MTSSSAQPAALDRLRELAEQAIAGTDGIIQAENAYIAAASPDTILTLLAERQQDRQRIADVTERYTEVVIGHARESYSAETVEYIFAPLLSPEAQPSSGGDEA